MGKKQSKVASQLPNDYTLVLKSDSCPACQRLSSLLTEYSGGRVLQNVYPMSVEQALADARFAPMVRRAYAFAGSEVGPIPMLMRVRNGRLSLDKRNVQLGTFSNVEGLKRFLA